MNDPLDTQIRMVLTELINSAPAAPSRDEIERREPQKTEFDKRIDPGRTRQRTGRPPLLRTRPIAILGVIVAVLLVSGILLLGGGSGPQGSLSSHAATWQLMDDQLSGTLHQNKTGGPPQGSLSCPTESICYVMAGTYKSAAAGTNPTSASLYVTTNRGSTWTAHMLPEGFMRTSTLACPSDSFCAAGGTNSGQPVLLTTNDGGQSFAAHSLPAGVGHLDTLSCPSPTYCAGLAADSEALNAGTTDATLLSTNDGGATFTDQGILPGVSMESLDCTSGLACTAVGWNDAQGPNDITAGISAKTADGGRTWTEGTLPRGLGISYLSHLECASATHCLLSGNVEIMVTNPGPPSCTNLKGAQPPTGSPGVGIPNNPQSGAVAAISKSESRAATQEELREAKSRQQIYLCSAPRHQVSWINDLATTTDGGLTWTPDSLPSQLASPMFTSLSCPSADQCWAAASFLRPQRMGGDENSNSYALLGTANGGKTWSPVTANLRKGTPIYHGSTSVPVWSIDCASDRVCVSQGGGNQGAPSVPTYSFLIGLGN